MSPVYWPSLSFLPSREGSACLKRILCYDRVGTGFFMSMYLMRHGRTRLHGTFSGSINPSLSARGRAQAALSARAISAFPIQRIYSSPQRRAVQTARIVRRRLPKALLTTNSLLKEIRFGVWEGLRFPEVERKWPALAKAWAKNPLKVKIPKGESFTSLRRRVKRFLAENKNDFKSGDILIVAHGGTLSAIAMELLKRPSREYPYHLQPTASIRKISGRMVSWVFKPC